jgi:hypothetical protein
MTLVGGKHEERGQAEDREEDGGGEETAPERVGRREGIGGQERDERPGVADGEPRCRHPAELIGRGDARKIRVVIDRRRLVRDNADHRQHPSPQDHARLHRRHEGGRGHADDREADEEPLACPGVVGDTAEQR